MAEMACRRTECPDWDADDDCGGCWVVGDSSDERKRRPTPTGPLDNGSIPPPTDRVSRLRHLSSRDRNQER